MGILMVDEFVTGGVGDVAVATKIIGSPGTALAGAIENELRAENANGIPEKIAKVKRVNVPLRTLRIRCFSCQIASRNIHNYLENFTASIVVGAFATVNKR
jgi:hypothetical protein